MAWTARPALLSPAHDATLTYPLDAFKLSWSPVPGASTYLVRVATDPALGSLVWPQGPIKTAATSFTLSSAARARDVLLGHHAARRRGACGRAVARRLVRLELAVDDDHELHRPGRSAPEIVDPYFAWARVPGAAGYEVEVNSSSDWAPGSKVCCDPLRFGSDATTIGTSHAPPEQLDNNTYYWRVRAIDPAGNAGLWNIGTVVHEDVRERAADARRRA